jgi:hypothetical protein
MLSVALSANFLLSKIIGEFCFARGQDSRWLEMVKQMDDETLSDHITFIRCVRASN